MRGPIEPIVFSAVIYHYVLTDRQFHFRLNCVRQSPVQAALIFAIVVAILSSLVVSNRLIESSCFPSLPLVVKAFESLVYGCSFIAVTGYLIQVYRHRSDEKWKTDWSFDKAVGVLSLLFLGFFPIILNMMTFSVLVSCKDELYSGNTSNTTSFGEDVSSLVLVSFLVLCTTVFLGVHEFKEVSNKHYLKVTLLTLGVSLFVLWVARVATEVTERSPLHKFKLCYMINLPAECEAMEESIDTINSMFTPLTIEFCIFCLTKIAGLLGQLPASNVTNSGEEQVSNNEPVGKSQEHEDQTIIYGATSPFGIILICFFLVGAIICIAVFVVLISYMTTAREQASLHRYSMLQSHLKKIRSPCADQFLNNFTDAMKTIFTEQFCRSDSIISNTASKAKTSLANAAKMYHILRLVFHILTFILLLFVINSLGSLSDQSLRSKGPMSASDFILMATGVAVVTYCVFCGFADVACLAVDPVCNNNTSLISTGHGLEFFDYTFNILQYALQTWVLIKIERKQLEGCLRIRDCRAHPLSGILLYLALTNALMWGVDSFYEVKSSKEEDLFDVQLFLYGPEVWNFITQLLYPAAVYFRFHSAIIFARAFYETLVTPDLEEVRETTSALTKELMKLQPDRQELTRMMSNLDTCWLSPKVTKVKESEMTPRSLLVLKANIHQLREILREDGDEWAKLKEDLDTLDKNVAFAMGHSSL